MFDAGLSHVLLKDEETCELIMHTMWHEGTVALLGKRGLSRAGQGNVDHRKKIRPSYERRCPGEDCYSVCWLKLTKNKLCICKWQIFAFLNERCGDVLKGEFRFGLVWLSYPGLTILGWSWTPCILKVGLELLLILGSWVQSQQGSRACITWEDPRVTTVTMRASPRVF